MECIILSCSSEENLQHKIQLADNTRVSWIHGMYYSISFIGRKTSSNLTKYSSAMIEMKHVQTHTHIHTHTPPLPWDGYSPPTPLLLPLLGMGRPPSPPPLLGMGGEKGNKCTHGEKWIPESWQIAQIFGCDYAFLIDLAPNRITFGNKSTGKGYF